MEKHFLSSDEIYEDLCLKIEKLKYMPGDKVSENDLCLLYGVTRHVVRSVITRLKERRLLTVYPQRGTFVSLIDMKYVETILYMRESVEHEAVHRLRSVSDDVMDRMIEKMEANLKEQKEAIERDVDMDMFYPIDNRFHLCFLEAVGSGEVMNLISEHYIHVRRWRNFEIRNTHRLKELMNDHIAVKNAFKNRDFELANEILHEHLNTVERLQDIFKNNSPEYFIFR